MFKKLTADAILPKRQTRFSAGFDVFAKLKRNKVMTRYNITVVILKAGILFCAVTGVIWAVRYN